MGGCVWGCEGLDVGEEDSLFVCGGMGGLVCVMKRCVS